MIQTLLLFGMIILAYLVSRMISGYTQMIRELKYLRSKINTGQSFSEKFTTTDTNTKPNTKPNTNSTTTATISSKTNSTTLTSTNSSTTTLTNSNSEVGGGKFHPSPQEIDPPLSLDKVFNTFHLPSQITNYIPLLKKVDIERMTKKDLYEPFNSNSYIYNNSPLGVGSGTVGDTSVTQTLTEKERTFV